MIVKPSLTSHVMRRDASDVGVEDQVKLTLAVEAKNDMMYDISENQNKTNAKKDSRDVGRKRAKSYDDEDVDNLDNEDDYDGEPAIGQKRKFKQLKNMVENDDDDDDEDEDYSRSAGGKANQRNARNKRARIGESEGDAGDQQSKSAGTRRADNFDSGSEEEYVPGLTIR